MSSVAMWIIASVFLICSCSAEKIIIIGAGAAGIATASKLLDQNITDFRILEAEHRVGGRIHSFHLGNAFVDIGAEFVHGEKDNVVYNLAKYYVKHEKNLENVRVYYAGKRKTGVDLIGEYISVIDELDNVESNSSLGEEFLSSYAPEEVPEEGTLSLGNYNDASITVEIYSDRILTTMVRLIDKVFEIESYQVVTQKRGTVITEIHVHEMLEYSKNFLRTMECFTLSLEGASRWFQPTTVTNYRKCEGDQVMSWNGLGYKTILEIMLRNFPNKTGYNIENQLSFGKTVSKITRMEKVVKIRCQGGSEYTSEYVVFTPSIGVLKQNHKDLFEPKLDKVKVDAIEHLGFDGVMKIILQFSAAWWGDHDDFVFVWNEEDRKSLVNDIPYGPVKDGDHWLSWFYSIGSAPANPNVLIGWIVGPMVPDIEKLTEEQIKNGTLYTIRKFLGNDYNVTEPIRVIHSKWCTNPNFRGTYSYETVESKIKNFPPGHHELSQPISGKDGIPRILFAGEATNTERFSTVDGAIETGYREANRLIEILKA